jgi:hypothetical protein
MNIDFATIIYEDSIDMNLYCMNIHTYIGCEAAPKYGVSIFISSQDVPGKKVQYSGRSY